MATVSKVELFQLYPEKHYTQKTTENDKIALLEKSWKEMQNMIELLRSQSAAKDEMYSSLQRLHETSQNRLRVLEELSFKA